MFPNWTENWLNIDFQVHKTGRGRTGVWVSHYMRLDVHSIFFLISLKIAEEYWIKPSLQIINYLRWDSMHFVFMPRKLLPRLPLEIFLWRLYVVSTYCRGNFSIHLNFLFSMGDNHGDYFSWLLSHANIFQADFFHRYGKQYLNKSA